MPSSEKRFRPNLKRPESVKVMFSEEECVKLQLAADLAGMGISVFIRVAALEAARKLEIRAA